MLNDLDDKEEIVMGQEHSVKKFRERTCCFTGHREIPFLKRHHIAKLLKQEVVKLIESGVIYFGAGGALGFDTMAAQTILSLRAQYPEIKLILVLPCESQADRGVERIERYMRQLSSKRIKSNIHLSNIPEIVCTSETGILWITAACVSVI